MRKFLITLFLLPTLAFAQPSVVAYNVTSGTVLNGTMESPEVSIASITKLMTIYTVLKLEQDLDEVLTVGLHKTPNTVLTKGMQLSRRELINLALIYSDNIAAITLSENYANGHAMFTYKMNDFARELEMNNSGFVEPTGLSPMNYSTLSDIIKLTKAVSEFDIVKQAAQSNQVTFTQPVKVKKKTVLKKVSRNPTTSYFGKEGIITVKTGFTKAAGFCITILLNANNQLYNVTVLGAKTKNERRLLVEKMLKDIYNA